MGLKWVKIKLKFLHTPPIVTNSNGDKNEKEKIIFLLRYHSKLLFQKFIWLPHSGCHKQSPRGVQNINNLVEILFSLKNDSASVTKVIEGLKSCYEVS